MNAMLRMNEALLIADRAFLPFQCIAWTPPDGTGDLSLSVIDRSSSRLLGRIALPGSSRLDARQLSATLQKSRDELIDQGYRLEPWQMPDSTLSA
ncbi:hypothetical protein [Pseudomonas sp. N040]|uniref:hypothetical protein n=1 Tax=Pseudomonas sp. N040 TaxID=2785325 RepID=UPI0018A30E06|nr:hypothetical protein [Pseudomonas sp. N040]MBF7731441.1 hypothetical protein [Pseudomonas sp. N040]MBW7015085.1 hypothetical protein [Pseudomonas sp. N040]